MRSKFGPFARLVLFLRPGNGSMKALRVPHHDRSCDLERVVGFRGTARMRGFLDGVVLKGKKKWGCAVASIEWGGGPVVTKKGC